MANLVSKTTEVAKKEVGYLEKKSPNKLYLKKANAGDNNYTKYGKWFGTNGVYWCAIFFSYIFYKAFGKEQAEKVLYGGPSASCEILRQRFIKNNKYGTTAKKGSAIFFSGTRHNGANHIGYVYKVTSDRVYTIEGNTSSGSEVIDNGGAVAYKNYPLNYSKILGYGYPKFDKTKKKLIAPKPTLKEGIQGEEVKKLQKCLNALIYTSLVVDGIYGEKTVNALKKYKQAKQNDNINGAIYGKTIAKKMRKDVNIYNNKK